MLRRLVIRDYLLVRELTLDFADGLTALTGETGAGKSMIVGALDVLLGERFSRDSIGEGAERAVIEGWFVLEKPEEWRELFPDMDDLTENEIILRREISRQGRTRSWLNDRPFPQDDLPKLRERLADFHGQREHQSLFKPSRQLDYLDDFAGTRPLAHIVAALVETRHQQQRFLEKLRGTLAAHCKDRALLEYQLEEIERLGLQSGEEDALEARLTKLESAEKLTAEASRLLGLLSESEPSLVALCGQAKMTAAGLSKIDRDLNTTADELADISSRLKDLAEQARHYVESLAFDEAELLHLRERRGIIWDLKRKHGLTLDQILARAGELKSLLTEGEGLEQACADAAKILEKTDDELVAQANELSKARQKAAGEFSKQVIAALIPLGFAHAQWEAALKTLPEPLNPSSITSRGADQVEFLFSANPGTPLSPLRDTASGGESSRVTLAIKTVLSEKAEYPLLVYDEIDLGISGRVADQVGMALAKLAQRHQVVVITHLPQIASRADRHLSVRKTVHKGSTETTALYLNEEQRVQEIAALIAGSSVTEKSLASARELLHLSRKTQNSEPHLG